jgi:16S rRNA processing protein RimM
MEVVAPEETLGELEEGEYYWHQLIGLKVMLEQNGLIGEVVRIEETAPELDGADLLAVRTDKGELLLPFIKELIKEVDLEGGTVVISRASDLADYGQ